MNSTLVVMIPSLPPKHRAAIQASAASHGYQALFYEDASSAMPALLEAEILFSSMPDLPKHAPCLRWLCTPSAGVEPFLRSDAFASPDALLTNSSGAYGTTIAEHIVMVTLELMRRQMDYAELVRRREWRRDLPVRSIRNSRVTMLGTGDIGQETAIRMQAFSPQQIIGVNRSGRNPRDLFDRVVPEAALDEVLPDTDLLIMSLPGTKDTNQMMNRQRLLMLPRDAFIVNVGRGNSLDQKAVYELLQNHRLAGAALDVFAQEPLPPDSPLWSCPGLLVTPHTAGNMTLGYTVDRIVELFLEDFENYCARRPLQRLVDRSLGY